MADEENQEQVAQKNRARTKSIIKKLITPPFVFITIIVILAMFSVIFWATDAELFKKADTELSQVVESVTGSAELSSLVDIVEDGEGGYCYQFNEAYLTQVEEELARRGLSPKDLNISSNEVLETFIAAELATQLPNLNGQVSSSNFSTLSYFWPVGSSSPDATGLYTGTPVSTNITSYFGNRNAPTAGASTAHQGIDIGVAEGTPVIASRSGVVKTVQYHDARGYYIDIDHQDGTVTRYQHLQNDSAVVSQGDEVSQGQLIAYSGNTGVSTGPHLHFEILKDGVAVDPLEYVNPENPRPKVSGVLENARQLTIELQENGFEYGATGKYDYKFPIDIQNGLNGKKVISCSSFVQEVLLRSGYTDLAGNEKMWATKSSVDLLAEAYNWEIITDKSQIEPGDIYLQDGKHVSIYAGNDSYYSSDEFNYTELGEPMQDTDRSFTCAYRVSNASFKDTSGSVSENVYENGKFQGAVTIQRSSTSKTVETEVTTNEDEEDEGDSNSQSVKPDSLEGYLIIGDSFMERLKNYNLLDGAYVHAVSGSGNAKYWLDHFDEIVEEDVKGVVVLLGANGIDQTQEMKDLLDKLKEKYGEDIQINVLKVFPVGSNYSYANINADEMNQKVEIYNEAISAYCQSQGFNFIDATEGLVNSQGYLDPADSAGIHIQGEDQNKTFYNNILENINETSESVISISGITGGGRNLKYMPPDEFDSMLNDSSTDKLSYFTIDDDGKVIVANWRAENEAVSYFRSSPIEFVSKIEKYTMPYQLLIAFQINLQDEDFTIDLANLALQTVTILSIQDNTTTSYTKTEYSEYTEEYETRRNSNIIADRVLVRAYSTKTGETITSVETNSISAQITKIDGWCAHFEREYSLNRKDSGYSEGTTKKIRTVTNLTSTEATDHILGDEEDQEYIIYSVGTTYCETVSHRTVSRTFSLGKTVTTGNEEKFVGIVAANKSVKSNLSQTPEMLVELLKYSDSTKDMVDLLKYLIYKATNKSLGVKEFDFSEYDLTKFNTVSTGGSDILFDYLAGWENSSVWLYIHDQSSYNSYIAKYVTEDKKNYICYTDGNYNGYYTRNYGYGVCHCTGTTNATNNLIQNYAKYGIDITSAQYNNIGQSVIPVEIVDNISKDLQNQRLETLNAQLQEAGITDMEEYQKHALIAISYQYGNMGNYISMYKQYGNTDQFRQNLQVYSSSGGLGAHPFLAGTARAAANWKLFHEGIYETGDGRILDPSAYSGSQANTEIIGTGSVTSASDALPTYSTSSNSRFGYRNHPKYGGWKMHYGEDYAAPSGTPIASLGAGTVAEMYSDSARGLYVRIDHGNGISTLYQHCSSFAEGLSVGDTVQPGQLLAYVGSTGNSTGPHLHLEVWVPRGQGDYPNWANSTTDVKNPATFDFSQIAN